VDVGAAHGAIALIEKHARGRDLIGWFEHHRTPGRTEPDAQEMLFMLIRARESVAAGFSVPPKPSTSSMHAPEIQERTMAALERLETDIAQLKEAGVAMAAQAGLPTCVDRAEADIVGVASEVGAVGQLGADIAALTGVFFQTRLGLLDSLIVPNFRPRRQVRLRPSEQLSMYHLMESKERNPMKRDEGNMGDPALL
jgi:hypothetical protein